MSALNLWHECRRRSLTLTMNGDKLRYTGPEESIAAMLPAMRANRDALFACVSQLVGLPVEDGPFTPYIPPATLEQVQQWQAELDASIVDLAALEQWPDQMLESVLFLVERQPVSTLQPDLYHFRERLDKARATSSGRLS
ncbi:hypothetical protein [Pandoraea sp.]|uniref:hypothetical protein n=1 Tax=Pandoraea sp. TaxID=1883445 RepID=UPI0035B3EFDC